MPQSVKLTNLLIFSSHIVTGHVLRYYRITLLLRAKTVSSSQSAFDTYRIGDKLHSVRVGRRYKEVLENGREMCVFFATLAGNRILQLCVGADLNLFRSRATFYRNPSLDGSTLLLFSRRIIAGPAWVFRNRTTHPTKPLKNSLAGMSLSPMPKAQERIYAHAIPGHFMP